MSPAMTPQPITDLAREAGIDEAHVELYGRNKAKIDLRALERPPVGKGRLILVSAINPTPAGEGKTTTSIALAMGMRRIGKRATLALREPSLGPVFGVKGGGTGGGRATLVPADDINLHFTGDLHAITTAHNLLSAMIDNACHFGTPLGEKGPIDARQVTWGRALDMNDRALRNVIVGLGQKTDGVPRQERFDITAASEVMAIAMTALLRDALKPNLVQTAEGGPALVHAGPFGNIAHGCNSVLATRLAMSLGDYAITEAGFGFDLGGEKFLNIKCRNLGVWPRMIVLVATLRALKMHGGAPVKSAGDPNETALLAGLEHLDKHLETSQHYGLPVLVAINVFPNDTKEEIALVQKAVEKRGGRVAVSEGFGRGGEGSIDLARAAVEMADATDSAPPKARFVYDTAEPIQEKVRKIAEVVYGASGVTFTAKAEKDIARINGLGLGKLPVCMAKTQLSLSDDPTKPGRPRGFTVTVREVRLSAGAGFVVPLTGDMMTMPGLPREPAALKVKLLPDGRIKGLMQND